MGCLPRYLPSSLTNDVLYVPPTELAWITQDRPAPRPAVTGNSADTAAVVSEHSATRAGGTAPGLGGWHHLLVRSGGPCRNWKCRRRTRGSICLTPVGTGRNKV